jgi:hypothetical protein
MNEMKNSTTNFLLILVISLLICGCIQPGTKSNNTAQINPTPMKTLSIIRTNTIPQDNDNFADYVKMDGDIFKPGHTIKFFLVNDGETLMPCYNYVPHYYVSHLLENGSSVEFIRPTETLSPGINYLMPGESSQVFSLDTRNWSYGLYKIRFDCGGVSRKFKLVERR